MTTTDVQKELASIATMIVNDLIKNNSHKGKIQ